MKIFYPVGAFYPSQLGGPNNTVYWMTKALVNRGVDVTIVTTHRGVDSSSGIEFNKWIDRGYGKIKYLKVLHRMIPIRLYLNSLIPLRNADIIHLTSLFYSGSLILALTAVLLNKRIVWSVRGELTDSALKYNSVMKKVILKVIGMIKSKVTFHGTSTDEIDLIKKRFGTETKTIEIPNYMDMPKRHARNPKEKYFMFLGRIHAVSYTHLTLPTIYSV